MLGAALTSLAIGSLGATSAAAYELLGPHPTDHPQQREPLGVATGLAAAAVHGALRLPRPLPWPRRVLWCVALALLAVLVLPQVGSDGPTSEGRRDLDLWQAQAGPFPELALLVHLPLALRAWRLLSRASRRHEAAQATERVVPVAAWSERNPPPPAAPPRTSTRTSRLLERVRDVLTPSA